MLIDPITLKVYRITLRRRTRAEALRQTLRLLKRLLPMNPNVCEEDTPELLDCWRAIFERNEAIPEMLQEPALEYHEPSGQAHTAEFVLGMLTWRWSQSVELDRVGETEERPPRDLDGQAKRLVATIREYGRWGPAGFEPARSLWDLSFSMLSTWWWLERNPQKRPRNRPRKIQGDLLREFLPCFDQVGVHRDRSSLRWLTSLANDFFDAQTNLKTMRSIAGEAEKHGTLRQHPIPIPAKEEEAWREELKGRRYESERRLLDSDPIGSPVARREMCIELFGDDLADVLLSPRSED